MWVDYRGSLSTVYNDGDRSHNIPESLFMCSVPYQGDCTHIRTNGSFKG